MFKLDLEKADEPEIKSPTSTGSPKKAREFQKNIYFCFTDYTKAFDGQGGLVCCSPWSHKESKMTERLNWADELFVYFEDQSLVGRIICKYFLSFCQLSFHFVYGFLCCAKAFKFNSAPLFMFVFISITLGDGSKKILLQLCEFDCVNRNKLENSSRDGNTRPPYPPPEKSVCRSRSNS